jgi:NADH-quinone oxidoreductase subunit L
MLILQHLWILLALPLLGSALNGLLGWRWPKWAVNTVGVGSVSLAFLAVVELIREFLTLNSAQVPYFGRYFNWISVGPFTVDFALQVDQLTVVMLVVVTFVSLLVHIYSTGYMAQEGGYARFFSYLNLFVFFMLTLVLAANLILMFVGWEGVGLSSYLLIGFWFLKKSASDAGKKAFITTRIGDFGFTIGILLAFWSFKSVDFGSIFNQLSARPAESFTGVGILTAIALLLFAGAVGKSAQLPLYVWLPDAMEGPTPVSALIHAATMVTAGVYMVARMHPLYSRAPLAMFVVALVGAITAFYSATIGVLQTDIKKVLAYSTVSQLGYMFLACGVGAYAAGIFHLMTHAFFKGLLFLAAGSVIHAMSGEQDMRRMGGLRKRVGVTYWTMLLATLAIAGIPGFSGFFSKDEILAATGGGPYANRTLYWLGLIAAGITSFYMFRLVFLTFFGKARYNEKKVHVHESPANMTLPLIALAICSVAGGWCAAPHIIGGSDYFESFVHPVFASYQVRPAVAPQESPGGGPGESAAIESNHEMEIVRAVTGPPVIAAVLGLLLAWWFYMHKPDAAKRAIEVLRGPYTLVYNRYYVDEIYAVVIIRPLLWLSTNVLWHVVDEKIIDGTVNGTADLARHSGGRIRELQSGNARSYASWVVIGAVGFTILLLGLWMVR